MPVFQEFPHKFQSCPLVSPRLGKDLQNFAFIVYRAPKIGFLATNADKNFFKMPDS